MPGEVIIPVPPLAVPPEATDLAALGEFSAVRLFMDRALAVRPSFDPRQHGCGDRDCHPARRDSTSARACRARVNCSRRSRLPAVCPTDSAYSVVAGGPSCRGSKHCRRDRLEL